MFDKHPKSCVKFQTHIFPYTFINYVNKYVEYVNVLILKVRYKKYTGCIFYDTKFYFHTFIKNVIKIILFIIIYILFSFVFYICIGESKRTNSDFISID